MQFRFSPYGSASTAPSPVNKMMAAFATDFRDGVDINLGVGYVNEKTIPDILLLEAINAVAANPETYRQPFNYGGPKGSPTLIQALRRFYVTHAIGDMDEATMARQDMVIGPSGATSILDALADLFAPGIVITADPMYYIYCNQLERKGFRVLTVPESPDGLAAEAVEERLQALGEAVADVAFFYVVTVNNPSGVILSNARKRALLTLAERWSAKLQRPVPIFFDQAYEWLIHDPEAEKPRSALVYDTSELAYEIGTLSKVLAPALRVGFIMGAAGPLLDAIAQKTSDVGFSAPLMNQEMAAYMLEHHIDEQLRHVNAGYREKARVIGQAVDEILGPWLEDVRGGRGGFYYYLTFRNITTDTASPFFKFLSRITGDDAIDGPAENRRPRVVYLPGDFCVHPAGASAAKGKRQLRLSYGFEDTEVIVTALEHMRDAIRYAEQVGCGSQ